MSDTLRSRPTAMTRRALLRRSGLGLGTLLVAGAGALAYRAYDQGVLESGHGPAYRPWDDWADGSGLVPLVGAAVLAPSPHNSQPWQFALRATSVDLYVDRSRSTGALDPFQREQHVGLGAAVENVVLAARSRGWSPTVLLMPSGGASTHVAHIALSPGRPVRSVLADQIPHRRTNRHPYLPDRAVPAAALESMASFADSSVPDARLVWLTGRDARARLSALLVASTEAILDDAEQRASDARWFRQSWDDLQRQRDGITIDAAGLPDLTVALAKLLPAQSPSALGEAWLDSTRERHTRTAAAYGVVLVRSAADPVQQLQGGRLLQRAHLWATAHGIGVHHMNQVTERVDRERQLGLPARTAGAFHELLPDGWQPLSTFRIGFPTHDAPRSPRRGAMEVIRP